MHTTLFQETPSRLSFMTITVCAFSQMKLYLYLQSVKHCVLKISPPHLVSYSPMIEDSCMTPAKAGATRTWTDTTLVEQSIRQNAEGSQLWSWSIPETSDKTIEGALEWSALTALLLLYRGNGSGSDGGFTWGFSGRDCKMSKKTYVDHGQVSNIVSDKAELLTVVIHRTSKILNCTSLKDQWIDSLI